MSFANSIGLSVGRKNHRSALLLVTGALCVFSAVQASAAPKWAGHRGRVGAARHRAWHPVQHRSIWAVKWAAANPGEEAAYLERSSKKWHKPAVRAWHLRFAYRAAANADVVASGMPVSGRALNSQIAVSAPQAESVPAPLAIVTKVSLPTLLTPSVDLAPSRTLSPADKVASDVTLDFVQADISDVLKALAVQTGSNIVSSADVKGSITVSLSHVSLEEALDMVARLSGYQYAKVGTTFVVGTTAGLADFAEAGSTQTPITSVVTFNYAASDDITNALKNRFPELKVSDGTAIDGSKAGAKIKALILSGDPTTVGQAQDLVGQIDASLGANVTEQSTEVYRIQYASIGDLVAILGSLAPNVVVTPGPSQGFTTKAPSASAVASSSSSTGTSSSGSSGAPSGATGASQSTATGPNLLLLTGSPTDIAKAETILAEVDLQPAQIDFETKVTEIDRNIVNNIGLNWDFSGATTRIGEEADNTAKPPATLGDNGQGGNLLKFGTIARTAISNMATVTMDALVSNGDAKLLADPNIASLDGQPAQVFIGDTVNYVQSITQTTTGENITTASVQVGVILRVTGKVNPDGYITLNIHPEVSEITGYLSVPGGGSLPQVASRYADTTVRVKNGETIAIGGLIQENDTVNVNKVPGLGDLPFFGKLFQDSKTNKQRTEVVFFLTTRVASGN